MQPEEIISTFNPQGSRAAQSNELIDHGLKELEELNCYIDILGISDALSFTPGLARGLEIYTGTVWEVFLKDRSITSSIGAGGRYDKL